MHKTLFGEGCLKWYLTVFSVFYEFLWGLKISSENVIICRALFWAQESIYVYLNASHGHRLYLWHAWQWQTSFLQHDSNITGKIKQFQWTKISPLTKFSLMRNLEILKTGKIVYWQCFLCSKCVVGWGSRCWEMHHPFTILSCQQPCPKHKSSLEFPVPSENLKKG